MNPYLCTQSGVTVFDLDKTWGHLYGVFLPAFEPTLIIFEADPWSKTPASFAFPLTAEQRRALAINSVCTDTVRIKLVGTTSWGEQVKLVCTTNTKANEVELELRDEGGSATLSLCRAYF